MRVRLLRASYFFWITVPIAGFLITQFWGLPHIRGSYAWRDDGQGYSPLFERHYTRCTFLGPYGEFTVYPIDGTCAWILFRKPHAGNRT